MNTPLDLDVFVAIYEAGSISDAAKALGEPRATLSRQLTRLEEHLGVRLIHRSTRQFEATRAGLELYTRARRIVDEVKAAEQALRQLDGGIRGPLRISIPTGPGSMMFSELLTSFLELYPEVHPDVFATNRHVDLVAEGFDVAIRSGRFNDPSIVRRVLARHRTVLIASPAYLAKHGVPQDVAALAHHACIVGYGGGDKVHPAFPLLDGGEIRVSPAMACNELGVACALVLAGKGMTIVPDVLVTGLLKSGRLVAVLPEIVGSDVTPALVYPERRLLEPQVRAFIDHAMAFFAAQPEALGGSHGCDE